MNDALQQEWLESRGIRVEKIALNPITLNDEDMKKIQEMEDSVAYGGNAAMMAGRMTSATATAMESAAANSAGAMNGFVGMGMVNSVGNGFNAAQQLYTMGQQQKQSEKDGWKCVCGAVSTGNFCTECGAKKPFSSGWTCSCGNVNTGKFCSNCGTKKPSGVPQYKCDKCGWQPEDPTKAPKFCPECGDPFDNGDIL